MRRRRPFSELRETISRLFKEKDKSFHLDFDVNRCSWDDVVSAVEKAHEAVTENERRGKTWHHRAWRAVGATAGVFAPGLSAIPDDLCVLHGGLAIVFSVR
jgi:hypothetical protein